MYSKRAHLVVEEARPALADGLQHDPEAEDHAHWSLQQVGGQAAGATHQAGPRQLHAEPAPQPSDLQVDSKDKSKNILV